MPRRPDLAEAIINRRAAMARGKRPPVAAKMTRLQRLAMAPKPPRGAAVAYIRAVNRLLEEIRVAVERELFPVLPAVLGQTSGPGVAAPVEAMEGVGVPRADGCRVCGPPPEWYVRMMAGDAFKRLDAARGPSGKAFGPASERFASLELAISEIVSTKNVVGLLTDVARSVFEHNRAEMSRVLRIDLRRADLGLQAFIQDFIRKNVNLIRSVGFDQLRSMEAKVAKATAGQVRVETLQDEILRTFDVSEARAALIARDQTLKANANLTQLRQQQAGVSEYIWTTSGDERVRGRPGGKWEDSDADHWVLEGTRQSWTNPPVTNPKTGARNHPGEDYQCRCTATPVVDDLLGPAVEESTVVAPEPEGEVGDWGPVGPQAPWEVLDSRRGHRRRRV
mgnify:CR=1 FL=1